MTEVNPEIEVVLTLLQRIAADAGLSPYLARHAALDAFTACETEQIGPAGTKNLLAELDRRVKRYRP